MQQRIFTLLLSIISLQFGNAQELRVEPPHWWTGFENNKLQLMIHYPNISEAFIEIRHNKIDFQKTHKADSPNYVFLDLQLLEEKKSVKFDIKITLPNGEKLTYPYQLLLREKNASFFEGFSAKDVVYLITPDRFANAYPSNDSFDVMNEKGIDRSNDYARHGGDIAGIIKHLDYIEQMGFTSLWPSPLLENDMHSSSYHGYAITDFYKVDPRFGTMDEYKKLAKELQQKNMKLIMDMIANHCGLEHWWMKDLPFKDWVNYQNEYLAGDLIITNHRRTTNQDAYASTYDKQLMENGWFVSTMPDLNQRNKFMATYIIQNSIWWVETLQLGGIRQDTYPYPNKDFMSDWAGAIMKQYPNFSIVGEEWSYNPLLVGYWQDGHPNKDRYASNLTSTMDFPLQQALVDAVEQTESWDTGLVKFYEAFANDFAYTKPEDILVFADNHDKSRIFTQLNQNIKQTKMVMGMMLVLPRIPQVYYGTEILMHDTAKPGDHGLIRTDFPGGWEGDKVNAFTGEGLTAAQKDMQDFFTKILNYRKSSKAITEGKTLHFAPFDNFYVLFRMHDDEVVIAIWNKNEKESQLPLTRFEEVGLEGKTFYSVLDENSQVWDKELTVKSGITIFTTKQVTK